MVSVIFGDVGAAVVVVATGISDTLDSSMVTFFVVVFHSSPAEVGADGVGVVGATWIGVDVGNSGTVVVGVFSSAGLVCRIASVVAGGDVVSGLMYGVVLLVMKGATGVTGSVVLAEVTVGKDTAPVSTGAEVGRGGEVVEAVLGKPGGMGVVVVWGRRSAVAGVVLVSVYAVVAVPVTVVLPVTVDVSETGARLGLEAVTIGVTAAECVVASVVSLVVCATTGAGAVMVVGPSTELVVGAAVGDGCRLVAVVVKSGCGKWVGSVEEVSQNRDVTAKGALLGPDVLGPKGPVVELTALVVHAVVPATVVVDEASVTLTVDSGSSTSGLTAGGSVGGDGGPAVLESSAAAEGETVTGGVGWSGAGGASNGDVCVLTPGVVVVILAVGPVCGGAEDAVVVAMEVWRGVVEAAVLSVVAEVTAAEVS